MSRISRWPWTSGLLLWVASVSAYETQVVYTELFYPYAYPGNDGKATGISVELTKVFLAKQDVHADFQFLPFQRALLNVDATPNVMLANLVRSTEREEHYSWLSLLFCSQSWLYGLADTPTPQSLDELPRLAQQHLIGSVRDSSSYRRLLALGVAEHRIEVVDSFAQNLGKLRRGRIDYITGLTHVEGMTSSDKDPLVFKIALSGPMPFYLVSSRVSDKRFVQRWQNLASDETLRQQMLRIREKYGMPECPAAVFGR